MHASRSQSYHIIPDLAPHKTKRQPLPRVRQMAAASTTPSRATLVRTPTEYAWQRSLCAVSSGARPSVGPAEMRDSFARRSGMRKWEGGTGKKKSMHAQDRASKGRGEGVWWPQAIGAFPWSRETRFVAFPEPPNRSPGASWRFLLESGAPPPPPGRFRVQCRCAYGWVGASDLPFVGCCSPFFYPGLLLCFPVRPRPRTRHPRRHPRSYLDSLERILTYPGQPERGRAETAILTRHAPKHHGADVTSASLLTYLTTQKHTRKHCCGNLETKIATNIPARRTVHSPRRGTSPHVIRTNNNNSPSTASRPGWGSLGA